MHWPCLGLVSQSQYWNVEIPIEWRTSSHTRAGPESVIIVNSPACLLDPSDRKVASILLQAQSLLSAHTIMDAQY
jgi:hypothetical protein